MRPSGRKGVGAIGNRPAAVWIEAHGDSVGPPRRSRNARPSGTQSDGHVSGGAFMF